MTCPRSTTRCSRRSRKAHTKAKLPDFPSDTFLCGGVGWDADGPALSLTGRGGGRTSVPVGAGAELRFRIASTPEQRFCLGRHLVYGPSSGEHLPCVDRSAAERWYQCRPCFARDDLRFMHDIHRSGIAPEGLRKYLAQPHWLYVATFANGATKIGTAADLRKYLRLVEQGAVVARYVARADDGRIVRVLEDAVTAAVGLQQAVRSSTKTAALAAPKPATVLDDINDDAAHRTRAMLKTAVAIAGFDVVDEQWQAPAGIAAVLDGTTHTNSHTLNLYPALTSGEHGFLIHAMAGACALLSLDSTDSLFLADLGILKGRIVELGQFKSTTPDIQESLF